MTSSGCFANLALHTEYHPAHPPRIVARGTVIRDGYILVPDSVWDSLYDSDEDRMLSWATPRSAFLVLLEDKCYLVNDYFESDSRCKKTQQQLQELGVALNSGQIVLKLGDAVDWSQCDPDLLD